MITKPLTKKQIEEYKEIFAKYSRRLRPNKVSPDELIEYLTDKYSCERTEDTAFCAAARSNLLDNPVFSEKLPPGGAPDIACFVILNEGEGKLLYEYQDDVFSGGRIFVGVDRTTGYFAAEGSSLLYDELCAFSGLDEKDLANYVLVAQYINCLKKYDMLDLIVSQFD